MKAIILIFVLFALCSAQIPTVIEKYSNRSPNKASDRMVVDVLNFTIDRVNPFLADHDVFRHWTSQDTIKLVIWYEVTFESLEIQFFEFNVMLGLSVKGKRARKYFYTKESYWYDGNDQMQTKINMVSMIQHITDNAIIIEEVWK